jgi:hypothetical protein
MNISLLVGLVLSECLNVVSFYINNIQNAYNPRTSNNISGKCYNKNHMRIKCFFIQTSSVGVKPEKRRSKTDSKLQLLRGHPCGEVKKCMKYCEINQNI